LGCHSCLVNDRGLEPAHRQWIGREEVVVDSRVLGIHVVGESGGHGPQVARLAAVMLDVEALGLREGIGESNEHDREGHHAHNRDQKPGVA
jgi:hypothetical protein